MSFFNVYDDPARASAYAKLDFPGTYYLAFRDLPDILSRHVVRGRALDFGCGAGRSTRFLKRLGFEVVGVDVSERMVELARSADPGGTYLRIASGDFDALAGRPFELVLSAFAFDNIPVEEERIKLLRALRMLLAPAGRFVLLGSTPEIYTHEWASFTTAAFPENRRARSGETVRIVMKDVPDTRPVLDLIWFDADYRRLFDAAGFELVDTHHPLGRVDEPVLWISETLVAPWVIYVLRPPHSPK